MRSELDVLPFIVSIGIGISDASFGLAQDAMPYPARSHARAAVIGDDPQQGATIGRIAGVAVARNGHIYVLDGADFDVKVFDTSGRAVRTFGRRGGGPGELANPLGLRVDDTAVVVSDRVNGSVTFSLNGLHLGTSAPVGLSPGANTVNRQPVRHGHTFMRTLHNLRPSPLLTRAPPTDAYLHRLVLLKATGFADTVATIRADFTWFEPAGRPAFPVSGGFGASGAWSLSGDSLLVVADGYAGRVTWYAIAAHGVMVTRSESLRKTGAPVTSQDLSVQESRIIRSVAWGDAGPPARARLVDPPTRWSVATQVFLAPGGDVWVGAPRHIVVRNGRSSETTILENSWIVFPGRGDAYTVTLPNDLRLAAVHGAFFIGVPQNREEPVFHVYRLSRH